MRLNFYGFDPSYHVARYNFVRNVPKSAHPSRLRTTATGVSRWPPERIMSKLPYVLVIDDELRSVEALERILEDDFNVLKATSVREAETILAEEAVQVVLCDQRMPGVTGVEFLKTVRERWPEAVRMIISGYTDAEDIIQGVNEAGIYQYVTKPWQPENLDANAQERQRGSTNCSGRTSFSAVELKMSSNRAEKIVVSRARGLARALSRRRRHRARCGKPDERGLRPDAAGGALRRLRTPYGRVRAPAKQLVARALHYNSLRWNRPFVVQNCAALPDETARKRTVRPPPRRFRGGRRGTHRPFRACRRRNGLPRRRKRISPAFQAKLLRVLQEGEIRPVGGRQTRPIDVRVIAATNRDLQAKVQAGRLPGGPLLSNRHGVHPGASLA